MDTLIGPDGEKGDKGDPGSQGEIGPRGLQGSKGKIWTTIAAISRSESYIYTVRGTHLAEECMREATARKFWCP